MESGHEYIDDLTRSDITIRAWGPSPEELFRSAWDAMLEVQITNPSELLPVKREEIFVRAPGLDFLLYEFLEEQLYLRDSGRFFARVTGVTITGDEGGFNLEAWAEGESFDPARHRRGTDVKAVTMHALEVRETADGWEAVVVLDV